MFNSPDEVTAYIRDNDVKFVDVRFCDLPGVMQHFTIPAETFGPDTFADGLGFDGSSIRGFQAINESDMLLLPDASSAYVDPFRIDRKSTRLNSSHANISYAVFCLKKNTYLRRLYLTS